MILSGLEIRKRLGNEIIIEPFDEKLLNPNSYNLRLHNELLIYEDDVLDMKKHNKTRSLTIPEEGLVLKPGRLYLGRTVEYTKTEKYVPMLEGRSSIGRLGLYVHVTAGFENYVKYRPKYPNEFIDHLYTNVGFSRDSVIAGIGSGKDTILILTLKFISAILLLPSIYYQMKLSLAIYVSISERYNERKIDFEKSIAIASEKFWRYLGVNIKYYLIILLPIIGVMAPFYFIKELFFKWTIVIVFGMSGTILASVFGFAPLMVVAENDR